MTNLKLYDIVLLSNGNKAQIVDLLDSTAFLADMMVDGEYYTITIYPHEIVKIL
ncbi:MAG: hypothetical protein ACI4JG_07915 [Acutalibacteraceae bacterium]